MAKSVSVSVVSVVLQEHYQSLYKTAYWYER